MIAARTLIAVALVALPMQDVSFTGVWQRNVEQSDDPQDKMQEAMSRMREQMDGGRGRGGVGGGGGHRRPGGGGRVGEGRGGRGGSNRGGRDGGPSRMARVAGQLTLEHASGELHVDNGEQLQIYYLDGEKHKREMANGTELETIAELKGNAVIIEEKMERAEIDRKFEISPDGNALVMTLTLTMGRMGEPVVIRTVYERAEGES